MTAPDYTASVGQKFNADGTVRRFPGLSIVCPVPASVSQHSQLARVQDRFRREGYSGKLAFLPPSSLHMTVIDLVCDQVRAPEHWSARLALDAPMDQVDRRIEEWVGSIAWPERICMRSAGIGPLDVALHLELEPEGKQVKVALKEFRDEVARITGIRHQDHEEYRFHVSLAYKLVHFDAEEWRRHRGCCQEVEQWLDRAFGSLTLDRPELVFFDDMHAFPGRRQAG